MSFYNSRQLPSINSIETSLWLFEKNNFICFTKLLFYYWKTTPLFQKLILYFNSCFLFLEVLVVFIKWTCLKFSLSILCYFVESQVAYQKVLLKFCGLGVAKKLIIWVKRIMTSTSPCIIRTICGFLWMINELI